MALTYRPIAEKIEMRYLKRLKNELQALTEKLKVKGRCLSMCGSRSCTGKQSLRASSLS